MRLSKHSEAHVIFQQSTSILGDNGRRNDGQLAGPVCHGLNTLDVSVGWRKRCHPV